MFRRKERSHPMTSGANDLLCREDCLVVHLVPALDSQRLAEERDVSTAPFRPAEHELTRQQISEVTSA